jgi:hypothetical protein
MVRKFSQRAHKRHYLFVFVRFEELTHHIRYIDRHHVVRLPVRFSGRTSTSGDLHLVPHLFVVVPQIQKLRHDQQLVLVVVLGGLFTFFCHAERFLLVDLHESRVNCFNVLRYQILDDKYQLGLHTDDTTRSFPLDLHFRTALIYLVRDEHIVANFKVRLARTSLRFMPVSRSGTSICALCRNLGVDLGHDLCRLFYLL